MRAGSPSRALAAAFSSALVLTVLLVSVPSSQAGFIATTTNDTNTFGAEGWKAIVALDGGQAHACLARAEGSVWCWGLNDRGQLGDTTTTNRTSPVQVTGPGGTGTLTGAVDVAAGPVHSCALRSDTTVWCWGLNDKGQLGDTTTTNRTSPVQVTEPGGTGTLTGVDSITAGAKFTCATKTDGTVWCWGENGNGQLGDGTTTDSSSPTRVF